MFAKRRISAAVTTTLIMSTGTVFAATPVPNNSSVSATFSQTYTGCYKTGQLKRHVTIAPGGAETLASAGITIDVVLRDAAGNPCANIPASDIRVDSPDITWCPGGNHPDGPTDASGMTTFTGTLCGGGCASQLTVYVGNVAFGTVPVMTNSPDFAHQNTSPGFVDISDFVAFAGYFASNICGGGFGSYDICADYNEDGRIDASDLAYFASFLGASCFATPCP